MLSVTHRDKELVKIRCLQARRWHTLVFFCRSGVHARPITNSNFEKLYFAAAMYVLPHIARVCEKRRVNTFTVEEELLEESSSCIRLSRIRMACQDRNLCSRRGVHEHFECRGRVARRIFELYADEKAMSKSEISVPLKIQNIVCSMQLDTLCALLFSTNEFL